MYLQDLMQNRHHASFLPANNLTRPPSINPSWVNWPSWNPLENPRVNQSSMREDRGMKFMVAPPGTIRNEQPLPNLTARPRSNSDQKPTSDYCKSDDEEDDGERGMDDESENEDGYGHLSYPGFQRKRLRLSSSERLERSRERNRIHARKTRQRKKVHLQQIQCEMEQLQRTNRELAQSLKERIAAIILLILRSPESSQSFLQLQGPDMLQDGLRVQDVVALESLGGETNLLEADVGDSSSEYSKFSSNSETREHEPCSPKSKVQRSDSRDSRSSLISGCDGDDVEPRLNGMILGVAEMAQMDIDLELLRKDRSQCTQQELDQIRRERNRMHAKRTRVRKKVQMEEIQGRIQKLAEMNQAMRNRLAWLGSKSFTVLVEEDEPSTKKTVTEQSECVRTVTHGLIDRTTHTRSATVASDG